MSPLRPLLSRRSFVGAAALAITDAALTGCHHDTRVLQTGTLQSAPGIPANSPLTIDVHCHIFNGTDLQVEKFLGYVTFPGFWGQAAGEILQLVNWGLAPSGDDEIDELKDLVKVCKVNSEASDGVEPLREKFVAHRQDAYNQARTAVLEVQKKESAKGPGGPFAPTTRRLATNDAKQRIYASFANPDYDTLQKNLKTTPPPTDNMMKQRSHELGAPAGPKGAAAFNATSQTFSLKGVIDFIIQYFQYRYVSAQDYIDTFTPAAQRDVDLMLASMVDYDWWLAKGNATPTTLPTQVAVMEQISILSNGRVHGFVPFCPLREVASRAGIPNDDGDAGWSSLDFVKDAVRNHGCVGIKLYPPMGFAPYGNSMLDDPNQGGSASFWKNDLLPDWTSQPIKYPDGTEKALGQRLDDALDDLYTWCVQEQVPILAHTSESNGPNNNYEQLALADHWAVALKKYSQLRVNFGHLGGIDDLIGTAALPPLSQAFVNFLGTPAAPNAYGDVAFSSNMLLAPASFDERIQMAYQQAASGANQLPTHLLYGTDWSLLEQMGNNSAYMKGFETLFSRIDSPACAGHSAQDCFFGWNAVEYLGLRAGIPGNSARFRLDNFYTKNCVSEPAWRRKLDNAV
jgi:predicted TIM-barrel fold metal-dependent hydrolase